jgi:hypothetical protein
VKDALVNKNTGEVLDLVQKTPEEMILDAREAAQLLQKVIASNDRPPLIFNGKQYLEFAHWQTIGKFYHCTASTKDAQFIEIAGVQGFKAHADLIDEKTGIIIGGADGLCMKDEQGKSDYAWFKLASMAQTRAARSALANKFRYVAIVAGYEPNLPDELESDKPKVMMPQEKIHSVVEVPAIPSKLITEKQQKFLYAKCRQSGITDEIAKAYMRDNFHIERSGEMSRDQLEKMLEWIQKYESITEAEVGE